MNDYYDKDHINDTYYKKTEIDNVISKLKYDVSTGTNTAVMWNEIIFRPTTLSEYGVKKEVQDMIDEELRSLEILHGK